MHVRTLTLIGDIAFGTGGGVGSPAGRGHYGGGAANRSGGGRYYKGDVGGGGGVGGGVDPRSHETQDSMAPGHKVSNWHSLYAWLTLKRLVSKHATVAYLSCHYTACSIYVFLAGN